MNSTIKYTATAILNCIINRWQKMLRKKLSFVFWKIAIIVKGEKIRYLYTIAHNLCVDTYRAKQAELSEAELLIEDKEDEILTGIAVKEAVSRLAKEEQELVLLRYVNEVPVSDICSILKISRFSLYRKNMKILRKLKNVLREEDFT